MTDPQLPSWVARPSEKPPDDAQPAGAAERDAAITAAALSFAALCDAATGALSRFMTRQAEQADSAPVPDGRWRCPECGGRMQALTTDGDSTFYGCTRNHRMVRATDAEVKEEARITSLRQRGQRGAG